MAQPLLTPFWPLFIRRSDGKTEVIARGVRAKNVPSQAQLDRTPNEKGVCDYYRELDREEPKHQDWRKKLGGMLMREIGDEAKATTSILWELPENYRLFEHIKSKADGQATKNHSGGGHDRQDAYLYGHPKGPKKRFRSPADFFPHLLWLATDEAGDYGNCTCKLCSPEQIEVEKPTVKQDAKSETPTPVVKKEPTPAATPPAAGPLGHSPVVHTPMRRPSASATPTQSPAPKPATPNAARIRPPPPMTPSPLPQPRSIDQQIDNQYGKFLARTGEVVWFLRPLTDAWGLGLVVRRWIPKEQSITRAYMIQALSHPYDQQAIEVITDDNNIKPWLAWSAPACSYAYLQEHALSYEQVNWHGLMMGQFGPGGDVQVDASILAAKSIDTSYTLFEFLKATCSSTGAEERHWNGLYFGAEKIWSGEPVRLRVGNGTDIMVITNIIERPSTNPLQNGPSSSPSSRSSVYVIGDIYTYATIPAPDLSSPPEPPPNPNLPLRIREDMRWRNNVALPMTHAVAYWKLIAAQSRIDISDIKGRWYESSILFEKPFKEAVKKGEGGDSIWMNARGDATSIGNLAGTRKAERLEAFRPSIPADTVLVEGLEPPPEDQIKPLQQHQMQLESMDIGGTQDHPFAIDDFMDLNAMDGDAMAGFGNGFAGSDNSGFHFG
ncbi:hypothetical protein K469DRAFT_673350 [Zopfia rhizophila CBS 207.26]|uniref:Cryptic loci regulator 2 N-terminal domain-containing protein n=1 Tax=Zopfia rhizophila CBS 207.26 TaxID=1314779 RepID=A0A6A6DM43_9PEZI|nr:hypothetical protein K469DRAFT_673350 [Zopfia rhizophila CBS 207.26]